MKTAFISRFGGLGDVLHAAHLPKLIREHYGVDHITFETNYQGYQILQGNPHIDELIHIDHNKITDNRLRNNWDYCEERYDLSFNLILTIEGAVCINENQREYYRDSEYRRKNFGTMSYYDVMTEAAGLPEEYFGTRAQLYYCNDEHSQAKAEVEKTKAKYESDFMVIVNLSGTSLHKKFVEAEAVTRKLLERYPSAIVFLTGDEHCKEQVFEHPRVRSWIGRNIRTVGLLTKYVDLTISMETGLPLIAHSWDAPCVHLLTAASPENHCKYAKNAYWLQAPVRCSPCHKNPREYWGCPTDRMMPSCVWFDTDEVMMKVVEAYEARKQ